MTDVRDGLPDEERVTDAFFEAACHHAEADVAHAEVPSFAAIVARAHRIDPAAVPAESVDRARKLGRPAALAPAAVIADFDGQLRVWMLAAREEAEADIARRAAAGPPPLRAPDRSRRSLRVGVFAACRLAAAAAVVLALDRFERWRLSQQAEQHGGTQSVAQVREDDGWRATDRAPEPAPRRPAAVAPPWHPPAEPVPAPVPSLPTAIDAAAPGDTPAPGRHHGARHDVGSHAVPARDHAREREREVPRESLLQRLDREAQAALAAGDREGADRLYAEVIAVGREHPLVELAFAERFALARRGGGDRQRGLYEAYLGRFPDGRFADAAQAGLCRAAPSADKRGCWADYLQRFPSGAYRAHAERWSPSDEPPTEGADDAP